MSQSYLLSSIYKFEKNRAIHPQCVCSTVVNIHYGGGGDIFKYGDSDDDSYHISSLLFSISTPYSTIASSNRTEQPLRQSWCDITLLHTHHRTPRCLPTAIMVSLTVLNMHHRTVHSTHRTADTSHGVYVGSLNLFVLRFCCCLMVFSLFKVAGWKTNYCWKRSYGGLGPITEKTWFRVSKPLKIKFDISDQSDLVIILFSFASLCFVYCL